jgi:hypothetical protein
MSIARNAGCHASRLNSPGRAIHGGDVGVVDDEALLNPQAGLDQGAFPLPRAQQIEADAS